MSGGLGRLAVQYLLVSAVTWGAALIAPWVLGHVMPSVDSRASSIFAMVIGFAVFGIIAWVDLRDVVCKERHRSAEVADPALEVSRQRAIRRKAAVEMPAFFWPAVDRARPQLRRADPAVFELPMAGRSCRARAASAASGGPAQDREDVPLRVGHALQRIDRQLSGGLRSEAASRAVLEGLAPTEEQLVEVFEEFFHRVTLAGTAVLDADLTAPEARELAARDDAALPEPLLQLGELIASTTDWTVRLVAEVQAAGQTVLDREQDEADRVRRAHLDAVAAAPPVQASRRLEELQERLLYEEQ